MTEFTRYRFVGPETVRRMSLVDRKRWRIERPGDLNAAARELGASGGSFSATYIVAPDAGLWIASLRSEHFACAAGGDVLAAGEITFELAGKMWSVREINNRSTGYCPEPSCWPAVEHALALVGLTHPGHFTDEFDFRLCPRCQSTNLIKDGFFVCACGHDLPRDWNFPRP